GIMPARTNISPMFSCDLLPSEKLLCDLPSSCDTANPLCTASVYAVCLPRLVPGPGLDQSLGELLRFHRYTEPDPGRPAVDFSTLCNASASAGCRRGRHISRWRGFSGLQETGGSGFF